MPSVVVTDLHLDFFDYLYAATYGRSSYKIYVGELGVDDFFASGVQLYPNPASEFVTIDLPYSSENVTVILYDQLGREVKSQIFYEENKNIQFSLNAISSGTYFVKIYEGNKQVTKKLLVR